MILKIKFFIKNIFLMFLRTIFMLVIPKDKKLVLLGHKASINRQTKQRIEHFLHNTKYLMLYSKNYNGDLKFVYLCDDKEKTAKLKSLGYKNIVSRNSIKGLYYMLRAKFWVYNFYPINIAHPIFAFNTIRINLWHGAGAMKKVESDIFEQLYGFKRNSIQGKILMFFKIKDTYSVANGDIEKKWHKTAFELQDEHIQIAGSPRLDVLYHKIKDENVFMEKDILNIEKLKEEGKKLFFYTPTFRDTGKDISSWLQSKKLKELLVNNNAVLVCKFHPAETNKPPLLDDIFYLIENHSDIYPLLRYADALITDYSSIYFDFLLLNKPIIYYVPDIKEYLEKCRDLYYPFDEMIAGEKTYEEDELLKAMQKVLDNDDTFAERRKELSDKIFMYKDGNNCERVVNFIEELSNQQ